MIKVSHGYASEMENGVEASVNDVIGRCVRDDEGNLEITVEKEIPDGPVRIVVRDGSDSTYQGMLNKGVLT